MQNLPEITVCPIAPDYGVSRCGRVFRINKWKFGRHVPYEVKRKAHQNGYLFVTIVVDGLPRNIRVHRMVAHTFLPNPEHKPHVAHYDGTRTNNQVENLRWATRAENMADCRRHGTMQLGDTHPWAKITRRIAEDIRERLANGERNCDIAARYGISRPLVTDIKKNRKWANV